jgi:hypothetical protein
MVLSPNMQGARGLNKTKNFRAQSAQPNPKNTHKQAYEVYESNLAIWANPRN